MGQTKSKVSHDALTNIAIDVTQSVVQKCISQTDQTINFGANSVAGDVVVRGSTFKQNSSIDVKCVMSAEKQNQIQNEIANKFAEHAESISQGMLQSLGGTKAEATANIQNILSSHVSQSDVQETISYVSQKMNIKYGQVGGNFIWENTTVEQTAKIIAEGMMMSDSYSAAINEISNKLTGGASAEGTGTDKILGDTIGDIAKTLGLSAVAVMAIIPIMIIIVILIVVMVPVLLIVGIRASKKNKAESEIDDQDRLRYSGPPPGMYESDFRYGGDDDEEQNDDNDDDDEEQNDDVGDDKSLSDDKCCSCSDVNEPLDECNCKCHMCICEGSDCKGSEDNCDCKKCHGNTTNTATTDIIGGNGCCGCGCKTDPSTGKCNDGCKCKCHTKSGGCGCGDKVTGGCCGRPE